MPFSYENIHDQVKSVITARGWTITKVVKKINEKRPAGKHTSVQNISNKLSRGTIKYSEINEIAAVIGCKLIWEPLPYTEENNI